jgi:curved DNA-binding protein CbpA
MATAAVRRAAMPPPPAPPPPGCEAAAVGSHFAIYPNHEKSWCCLSSDAVRCPERVNRSTWRGDEAFAEREMWHAFTVSQTDRTLRVRRAPEQGVKITHGWGIELAFDCCEPRASLPPPTQSSPPPPPLGAASAWQDHYLVLGVPRDFSADELKRAYRQLSLARHPDRPGGSAEAFARTAVAHDCLGEKRCREAFDTGADLGRLGQTSGEYTVAEDVQRKYLPERHPFEPFGDPATYAERRRNRHKRGRERDADPQPERPIPQPSWGSSCPGGRCKAPDPEEVRAQRAHMADLKEARVAQKLKRMRMEEEAAPEHQKEALREKRERYHAEKTMKAARRRELDELRDALLHKAQTPEEYSELTARLQEVRARYQNLQHEL